MARKMAKSIFFQVRYFKKGQLIKELKSFSPRKVTEDTMSIDFDNIYIKAKWGWGDNEAEYDNKKQALQFIRNNAEDARDYVNNL